MLPNRYRFQESEPELMRFWAENNPYTFDQTGTGPLFTIDTPPPTVSGALHIGHCYSYTQTDVIARFQRMLGKRVFYPMGFDDNGLPTERFVEKSIGQKATEIPRAEFLKRCQQLIEQTEEEYEALWRRLGLSVDWQQRYTTISPRAQRTSQWSFIQLYQDGRAYTQQAPTLWCPECQTAIAQAEVEDSQRPTLFSTLAFTLPDGSILPIATTRPELLTACVAIFVHPDDARYAHLIGQDATIEGEGFSTRDTISVPILGDELVEPAKGSGAVMCCTFGDSTDVRWWHVHRLPLLTALERNGRMSKLAGSLAGLSIDDARQGILKQLAERGLLLRQETIEHTLGAHERCGTAVEYLQTRQWFIRVLDQKERFLEAGRAIKWQPEHMRSRYEHWVENLQWDWCISRQRFLGVPFPAWTCRNCGTLKLAELEQLPIDPRLSQPIEPCACGSSDFEPEADVMDTWATSSCTPLIIGNWTDDPNGFTQDLPIDLRPQAHDIIRTWAFYSIAKSLYHTGKAPWKWITISGHALAANRDKISKSKAHREASPSERIEQESADALRYWATSIKTGTDTTFTPETLANGRRLVTKLWNACRFAAPHLEGLTTKELGTDQMPEGMYPTDRWLLHRLAQTIDTASRNLHNGEYAAARSEVEHFFWSDLCDNYLELAKARLYSGAGATRQATQWTLYHALLSVLKLLAPYLPFVTEQIYQLLFRQRETTISIHIACWPSAPLTWQDEQAKELGEIILSLLQQVRRYKAEHGLSVGAPLTELCIRLSKQKKFQGQLEAITTDLKSATRAERISFIKTEELQESENWTEHRSTERYCRVDLV